MDFLITVFSPRESSSVSRGGGFHGFLETSHALALAYTTVQLANYLYGITGSELTMPCQ